MMKWKMPKEDVIYYIDVFAMIVYLHEFGLGYDKSSKNDYIESLEKTVGDRYFNID